MNTALCPGSRREPRYSDVRGGYVRCRYCPSWVPASVEWDDDAEVPFLSADEVPNHVSPVTAGDIQRATNVLWGEYNRARRDRTLHSDPDRWHLTALDFALPGHVFAERV